MKDRFINCLDNQLIKDRIKTDFVTVLSSFIGSESEKYVNNIIELYPQNIDRELIYIEQLAREYVKTIPNYQNIFQELNQRRAQETYKLIKSEINLVNPSLDFGCGNGLITQNFVDNNFDVSGSDVIDYRNPKCTFPFYLFSNYHIELANSFFVQGWSNSVLHHDESPDQVIKEISRVVRSKFILIEDYLHGQSLEEINLEKERLFANDYFYNRLLTFEDVPVPGKFLTPEEWMGLFKQYDWQVSKYVNLGPASILKSISKVLIIFER